MHSKLAGDGDIQALRPVGAMGRRWGLSSQILIDRQMVKLLSCLVHARQLSKVHSVAYVSGWVSRRGRAGQRAAAAAALHPVTAFAAGKPTSQKCKQLSLLTNVRLRWVRPIRPTTLQITVKCFPGNKHM